MPIKIYAMYNNKGGVGKTTLGFNVATQFAEQNPDKQVLVIDLCPQANISQYLLGGGGRGYDTNQGLQSSSTRRNVVGFIDWLLDGNSDFTSIRRSFKIPVKQHNQEISSNLYLIAGDSFLESLSLALNYAVINPANRFAWSQYMTAFRRLCDLEHDSSAYNDLVVFIDCNPSFSVYTQMALLSSDMLIVPMMADYSSLEGIKGIMTLLFGHYPTAAASTYAEKFVTFHRQVSDFNLPLPKFERFVFNNFTSNLGVASAYNSIKSELCEFVFEQYQNYPHLFTHRNMQITEKGVWENEFLSEVKDFHTSGKVSASLGIPLFKLPFKTKYVMPDNTEVSLVKTRYEEARDHVNDLVSKFN